MKKSLPKPSLRGLAIYLVFLAWPPYFSFAQSGNFFVGSDAGKSLLFIHCFSQSIDWEGEYTFIKNYGQTVGGTSIVVNEELQVEVDPHQNERYTYSYEVAGYQTYYKISGYALANGNELNFFFTKVEEGFYAPEEQINPKIPFFTLQYVKQKLLTKWVQPTAQKNFHPYFTE